MNESTIPASICPAASGSSSRRPPVVPITGRDGGGHGAQHRRGGVLHHAALGARGLPVAPAHRPRGARGRGASLLPWSGDQGRQDRPHVAVENVDSVYYFSHMGYADGRACSAPRGRAGREGRRHQQEPGAGGFSRGDSVAKVAVRVVAEEADSCRARGRRWPAIGSSTSPACRGPVLRDGAGGHGRQGHQDRGAGRGRHVGLAALRGGRATYFMVVNRSKKSLNLNLKAPEGQADPSGLIARADVALRELPPRHDGRLGFGFEASARRSPGSPTARSRASASAAW